MAEEQEDAPSSPEVHFEPVVKLPLVEIKTLEEEEEVMFKMRAKLFRYDTNEQPPEWKERGIGDVKILKHKDDKTIRILMRRDKTLKVCANHYIQPYMELKPNNTSDRAWVWNTLSDFADEEPKPELLAIKFASAENAQKFKAAFDEAKREIVKMMGEDEDEDVNHSASGDGEPVAREAEEATSPIKKPEAGDEVEDSVADKLSELSVNVKSTEVSSKDKDCAAADVEK